MYVYGKHFFLNQILFKTLFINNNLSVHMPKNVFFFSIETNLIPYLKPYI